MDLTLPIIGLANERKRLREAIRNREPLLVIGPRGSGKTRIIQSAIGVMADRSDIVYVEY